MLLVTSAAAFLSSSAALGATAASGVFAASGFVVEVESPHPVSTQALNAASTTIDFVFIILRRLPQALNGLNTRFAILQAGINRSRHSGLRSYISYPVGESI